jgi:hypothetical protein
MELFQGLIGGGLVIIALTWILFPILVLMELRLLNRSVKTLIDYSSRSDNALSAMRKYYEQPEQPPQPEIIAQPKRETLHSAR